MGHLLEAIKKLEQRRVPKEPQPIGRARSKTPRGKIRRVDKGHPIAALPRAGRKRSTKAKDVADLAPACVPELAPINRSIDSLPLIEPVQSELAPVELVVDEALSAAVAPAWTSVSAFVSAPVADELPPVFDTAPITAAATREAMPEEMPIATVDISAPAMLPSPIAIASRRVWEISRPTNADDYRHLAAYLFERPAGGQTRRSMLLTAVSAAAIEAVSLPALAVALSSHGNVLWIAPRHSQPASAEISPARGIDPGWHELAAGQATWEQVISPTSLSGISFIGGGAHTASGRPMATERLFESLQVDFSFVLVEGGLVDESGDLAAWCESAALAVAIGHDRRGQIENALSALAKAGANTPLIVALG